MQNIQFLTYFIDCIGYQNAYSNTSWTLNILFLQHHDYSLNTCIICSLHPHGLFIVFFESLTFLLCPYSSYFFLFSHKQRGKSYVGQRVWHVLILPSDRCPWINNKQSLSSIWSELDCSYKNTLFVVTLFHEAGNNDPNLTEVLDVAEPQSISQTFRKSFPSPQQPVMWNMMARTDTNNYSLVMQWKIEADTNNFLNTAFVYSYIRLHTFFWYFYEIWKSSSEIFRKIFWKLYVCVNVSANKYTVNKMIVLFSNNKLLWAAGSYRCCHF